MALEIINLHTAQDFVDLSKELGNDYPVRRILYAAEVTGCNTAVKETGYDDEEYKKEYELFYKNVFKGKPPADVIRIHLFEGILSNLSEEELTLKSKDDAYLGYFTLRPTKIQRVCDAFISEKVITDEESRFVFLTCKIKRSISIEGVNFEIKGFPYIQQDSRIAACAQCAIRVISQFLGWEEGKSSCLTAPDITEKVKTISNAITPDASRQIPTSGLTVPQMKAALGYLNCDPILYDYSNIKPEELFYKHPEQIIYRYVESGIPVILGINTATSKHVLVVIGHSFNPDLWWRYVSESYYQLPRSGTDARRHDIRYHSSVDWIQNFVIQDDNLGPYYFMERSLLHNNIACILVPLPEKVYLTGEEAELKAYDMIYRDRIETLMNNAVTKLATVGNPNAQWLTMYINHWTNKDLVLRTYLRKSEELKGEIDKFTRSASVKNSIVNTPMSKHVWIVEISWPDIFSHTRKKCGEIILDATADTYLNNAILHVHIPGVIMKKNAADELEYVYILDDDQPFRHLYRKKVPIPKHLPMGSIA